MSDYKEGFERLEKKVEDELEKCIRQIAIKISDDASDIIIQNKAIGYQKQLYRSIRYNVYKEAARIIGVVGVGANVPYGIFRHEGTRPHFPPIDPIQKWVVYKGLVKHKGNPTSINAIRTSIMVGSNSEKSEGRKLWNESRQIAFAIARKISKKGTQGLPFLKLALNQNREFIQRKISEIII